MTHADAYTILNSHTDILPELNISGYSKLTAEKTAANMAVLNARPYSSPKELITTANKAIATAKSSEKPGTGSGGGSKTDGSTGGKTSFTSTTPINNPSVPNTETENAFSDIADVPWAQEAVFALAGHGVVMGNDSGRLLPQSDCIRAEAAKIIYMILKYKNNY